MTKIEWTHIPGYKGVSWNPIRAEYEDKVGWHCVKRSGGCINCYSERINMRLGTGLGYNNASPAKVYLDTDVLKRPYGWRKKRAVFVCSMTDLFNFSMEWVKDMYKVMANSPDHIFMVLTKNPVKALEFQTDVLGVRFRENIWMGVTAENQRCFDERVPVLLDIDVHVRFLSMEPLIDEVDFPPGLLVSNKSIPNGVKPGIDWVIVGGESGPDARPMHPDWARYVCGECEANEKPFFFKQHGEWIHESQLTEPVKATAHEWIDGTVSYRVGKKKAGRLLDGVEWSRFPGLGEG